MIKGPPIKRTINNDVKKAKPVLKVIYLKTFKGLRSNKKGQIIKNKFKIVDLINKDLNNNDYLMIKGSNSTGLHKISNNLKQGISNVV